MTSRQIIQRVLSFNNPPRIGLQLPHPRTGDVVFGWRQSAKQAIATEGNEARRWRDDWGVTWASLTSYDKGEVVIGAIEDWSQLGTYMPPDLGRQEDYSAAAAEFASETERFRIGGLEGLMFNAIQNIRRLDNYLCDLMLEPQRVATLHEKVRPELMKNIDSWADAGADAVMFWEDWGTQDRLLVSPALWREVFRPDFEAMVNHAHRRGLSVVMHSCGAIDPLIDDLIEVGIDCLQFDQPTLHGIDHLSCRYGGRVAFWCPVDIQRTLQSHDGQAIRQEARRLIEKLGCFGGGFIGGYYSNDAAIGLPPGVQDIAAQTFEEYAAYGAES